MIGKRFGSLTVISRAMNDQYGNAMWNCICDCGTECVKGGGRMRAGSTKSCGCLNNRVPSIAITKHNLCGTPEYKVWSGIVQRTTNKNNPEYAYYGGRGIVMCDEWRNNPKSFCNWLHENGWKKGLTIDRIDNNKGYSPENCRVATRADQNRNTSRIHRIKGFNGEELTAAQAAELTGLSRSTVAKWCRNGLVKTIGNVVELEKAVDNPMHKKTSARDTV